MAGDVSARYIVEDVDAAIEFYTKMLNFKLDMHPAPEFAIVSRKGFRLYLTKPSGRGGGGQSMSDGSVQSPGGWNRLSIEVEDLDSLVDKLGQGGCKFRNEIVTGVGGKQILVLDPSGNLVELFQYFQEWKPTV
ncbi:MAG TPA: VOC family protein [Nitrososphaerales archaeon]|nr:VOC family protein [Nitrososphaerales archaeon]